MAVQYVKSNQLTVAEAWIEWCDGCSTVHMHARVYLMPESGDPAEATPWKFHDCAHQFDHVWQD